MALKRKSIVIGGSVIVLIIVFAVLNLRKERAGTVEVETETVRARSIKSVVTASGSIRPKRKVEVSASQMGTVTEVAVREGDEVEEGDFLLQIDPVSRRQTVERLRAAAGSAKADLALARAGVKKAEQEYERIVNLRELDLASPQDLLAAETERDMAKAKEGSALGLLRQQEAAMGNAEHDLGLTTLRAPMAGVVVELNVEEGETAIVGTMNNPGTKLLVIADLSELESEVEVDETDVVDIQLGMDARITIDSYPDTVFHGRVTEIGNSAIRSIQATESVDFEVVITLDDPVPGAKPGLSATADIIVAEREDVLSVPIQSLTIRRSDDDKEDQDETGEEVLDDDPTIRRERSEEEGVFVVEDGAASFVPVETGIAGDRYFEVLSGLEGDEVVVSGDFQAIRDLEDGDPVKTAKKKKKKTGGEK